MNSAYIITESELANKGLELSNYTIDDGFVPIIIQLGLDIAIDRICQLDDDLQFESDIEELINNDNRLIEPFKKLQYRIIYNLVFQNEQSPIDPFVDSIICQQLKMGKINGFQKGLWYRNN